MCQSRSAGAFAGIVAVALAGAGGCYLSRDRSKPDDEGRAPPPVAEIDAEDEVATDTPDEVATDSVVEIDPARRAAYANCWEAPDQDACAAAGGTWRHTWWGWRCVCVTGQEGAPCATRMDCLSHCNVPVDHDIGYACGDLPVGTCDGDNLSDPNWCHLQSDGCVMCGND